EIRPGMAPEWLGEFRQVGQEVGQNLHLVPEAEIAVLRPAEFAFRDDQVHVVERAAEKPGMTPELWRAPVGDLALQAMAFVAKFPPVAPEHAGRATEPELERLVELQALSYGQRPRPAGERVVVVQ